MIAVISGDIIGSRKLENQEVWLKLLQNPLNTWGESPKDWNWKEVIFFQEVSEIAEALKRHCK